MNSRLRTWLALLGAMLGAFMAVLDIQITNASLPNILGSLGGTVEEGSWISTSYLVAEIIVIPVSGWLTQVFSVRRYLIGSAIAFLLSSVACASAWSLGSMIAFRALQGFSGGVLIPIAFNLVLKLLPPEKRNAGFVIFGMTATFAPAIGPTIGGWLTENFGWPSIFYLNIAPGLLLIAAIYFCIEQEPLELHRLRNADWYGIATMAIGLGTLIVFLEEGTRHDWLNSPFISAMGAISAVSLLICIMVEIRRREPFIELRLLRNRNFAISSVISAAFGAGMYGVTYLLPLYLSQVQGYNAQDIGRTIMWSGAPQVLMMPVAALLLKRFDARLLLTAGLFLFAGSSLMNAFLTNQTGYNELKVAQLVRAAGLPLVIVPLTTLATAGIAAPQAGSASALFNMLRNLGGSIGIALLATQLDWREKLHSARLGESVNLYEPDVVERLSSFTSYFLSRGFDAVTSAKMALQALATSVRRESFVMAYADCFAILGCLIGAMLLLVWICRAARGTTMNAH